MIEVEIAVKDLITGSQGAGIEAEPFYGNLLARIPRRIIREGDTSPFANVDTAAVAIYGSRVWLIINEKFFKALSRRQRVAVVKHEAQHLAHRHLTRPDKDKYKTPAENQLLNIAMDAVINQYNSGLPHGVVEGFGPVYPICYTQIEGAQPHDRYEEYYRLLKKQVEKNNSGGKGSNANGTIGGTIDDHSFFGEAVDGSNVEIADGLLKEAIRDAANKVNYGSLPHHIQKIINDLNGQSKLNWRVILRRWIKQSQRRNRDKNIFRESPFIEGVFPYFKNEPRPEYDVYVDASGSVSDDEITAFFNEVLAIQKGLKATVRVHQFDTTIHRTDVLEHAVPEIERAACGGTSFAPVVEHAKANNLRNIIIMTDGYAPVVDTKGLRVLWVYTPDHQKHPGRGIILDDV